MTLNAGLFICLFAAFLFLYIIYIDTKIDPFQQQLGFQEKKNFFLLLPHESKKILKDNQCDKLVRLIVDPKTKKLGDVFESNIDSIHICAYIMILVFYYIFIVLFLFYLFYFFRSFNLLNNPFVATLYITLSKIYKCIGIQISVFYIIILIYMIYLFYSGDINTYCDFLSCENINREGFFRYVFVEKIKSEFIYFLIPNIITSMLFFCYNLSIIINR